MRLKYLLEKEFKQIRRDRFLPRIIFLVPLMQLIILPFAANFEMHNINLSIVDNNHSVLSQRLTDKVLSSGYFKLTGVSDTYDEALHAIEKNTSDIILEIPNDFDQKLGREGSVSVLIAADAVNGTKGGMGSSYLSSIIRQFNEEHGYSIVINGGNITSMNLFNPHLNYKNYMVPGIIAFLLTIIGGFVTALNIVSEKEKGTIEQINVTPVPKVLFLLSKLIPSLVICLILLTLGILIAFVIYGLVPAGSIGVIYLFCLIYLIAFTGFGIAVSAISSTQQQAMFTTFFFFIIFALLSGLFTPISSMPEWAQYITLFNPLRYLVEVMRMVYLKGSTLADLGSYFGIICLFALFFNLLAVLSYRKKG